MFTGGRDYLDPYPVLYAFEILQPRLVIVGDATGADAMVEATAKERRVPFEVYYANWTRFGNRAGPIRNQQLVDRVVEVRKDGPAYCVWFMGEKGTPDAIERAEKADIQTIDAERLAHINKSRLSDRTKGELLVFEYED